MPPSKFSILIVDEDSRASRIVRDRFGKAFPEIRVEIAGSAAKASAICSRFPPSWIVWDGHPLNGVPLSHYVVCIPDPLWKKVIPVSSDPVALDAAKAKGALPPVPKQPESFHAWTEALVETVRQLIPAKRR